MDERSAVEQQSGATVDQSVPGLRRPTSPATAGRKPAARPYVCPPEVCPESCAVGLRSQPKTGRGAGQSLAVKEQRAALHSSNEHSPETLSGRLEEHDIRSLLEFFTILDRWDREEHAAAAA